MLVKRTKNFAVFPWDQSSKVKLSREQQHSIKLKGNRSIHSFSAVHCADSRVVKLSKCSPIQSQQNEIRITTQSTPSPNHLSPRVKKALHPHHLSLRSGQVLSLPHKKFLFAHFFSHLNFIPTQKLNRKLKTLQIEIAYEWKKYVQQEQS